MSSRKSFWNFGRVTDIVSFLSDENRWEAIASMEGRDTTATRYGSTPEEAQYKAVAALFETIARDLRAKAAVMSETT